MSIPESVMREIERAMQAAEFPRGMSVHDGKAKVHSSHLRRVLAELAALRADAERYRWLREKYTIVLLNGETEMRITHGPCASSKSGIDDIIDAARGGT